MDPKEFLSFSNDVYSKDANPAAMRSVVSRCYYAAILSARDGICQVLDKKMFSKSSGSMHGKVPMCLRQSKDTELQKAGRILDELRADRNKADYDLKDTMIESDAKVRFVMNKAAKAVQILDRKLYEEPTEEIREALEDYIKIAGVS